MIQESLIMEAYKQYKENGSVASTKAGTPLRKFVVPSDNGSLVLLEQNKYKSSKWAALARKGSEVIQVVLDNNTGNWKYVGVIVDGNLNWY